MKSSALHMTIVGSLGALCVVAMAFSLFQLHDLEMKKRALMHVQRELDRTQQVAGNTDAVKKLEALADFAISRLGPPPPPELSYRILLRQWAHARDLFNEFLSARENEFLKGASSEMRSELQAYCRNLKAEGSEVIAQLNQNRNVPYLWRVHNLRGCVAVLLAYLTVEFDNEMERGGKLLKEAVSDFKKAIELVDQAERSNYERMLPRWNLELITGRGQLKRIARAQEADVEELLKQMEVIRPDELGGYAPGVPLETQVEK